MSKKKNHSKKRQKTKEPPRKSNKSFMVIIALILFAGAAFVIFSGGDKTVEAKKTSFNIKGGETRPVLNPAQFTGMTRAAYAAAAKYPQVLDQVRCYCNCDEPPFYHKSLLSCFVETHGAG